MPLKGPTREGLFMPQKGPNCNDGRARVPPPPQSCASFSTAQDDMLQNVNRPFSYVRDQHEHEHSNMGTTAPQFAQLSVLSSVNPVCFVVSIDCSVLDSVWLSGAVLSTGRYRQ